MALPKQFADILDNHGDTLQNMALLAYLKNEEAKPFLDAMTAAKVCKDIYQYLSKDDQIDKARAEAILNISKYVKDHPRARQTEIQHKVEEEITIFKLKIQSL
ncbi:uncharacterized protein LOC131893479 isoform X3 [Tigriopus californicus]|uniref:uncharacterized protein LOC131893479 isoform X3 n=1 Tax=Tigriopus californicus TaxID=6832 RepID=UPI0027D9F6C6|nr:uncharacterized protein LOC131893479 isoform X3 [Tigriopus californicus]